MHGSARPALSPRTMLSRAAALLALLALSGSLSLPLEQPVLCSNIRLFRSSIREALQDLQRVEITGTATIPVNTMEKGCVHSHLSMLLAVLNTLNSNIVQKLQSVNEWTKQYKEFYQGSSEECKTAETAQKKFFLKKTSEFLKFLYQELSCQSETTTPSP